LHSENHMEGGKKMLRGVTGRKKRPPPGLRSPAAHGPGVQVVVVLDDQAAGRGQGVPRLAQGESVIKCPSPPNVLNDACAAV
jgi:hypothetical protein